ncbi:hypothetical protein DM860_000974 [Cuscuta australis]|uniref:PNPLA domain-containing protein n=1 Tax=Cuscuta australis TaxID=267555 RepID=A0A328DSN2_9ASTE|nr:hypothetical protein DM860_000974 [Cuscuta australis]
MDVSSESSVEFSKIGPSSILGRTIAFKILFCKSLAQLRFQVYQFLLYYLTKAKNAYITPVISWFHPRNPQGILALVIFIAFLLKRYTNIKVKAEMAYRRKFWRNMMKSALSYEEWAHAAKMLDRETLKVKESDLYDVELVMHKLQELQHRRQEGSLRDIMFCMRADLVRNLGNMCNPQLHKGRLHVPKLIKEYIDEVSTQLRMVCDSDSEELLLEEKLAFMHETRHAFGRTALLLSGGASLGAFHVGVAKTLVEHKLLPRIIAGSSVGSIICSIIATKSWPELQSFFEDSWRSLQFFDQMGGIFTVFKRVMTHGAVHEIRQLQWMLRVLTNNLTFQEAYDMTGRILSITVCSPRKHEPPRCLNYLTSPHVVIWSAVTASCAFPGLFEAQELMAKDRNGDIVPYHPPFHLGPDEAATGSARRWRDGSLEIDLPMMQLKELFNVNHFIVSQANPHIAPLLRMKEFVRAYGGNFAAKVAHLVEMEVKHRCNQILELGFPLGGLAKLFAQEWEGDVTIVMPATLAQYSKIIQNPSTVELQKAANQGRRCTWEKLSAIKANCGIEIALDECVAILNHMRRLRRSAERAASAASFSHGLAASSNTVMRFNNGSRRIPSWNCIARENSTGSLEEYLPPPPPPPAANGGPSEVLHQWTPHHNVHEVVSDSESETDLNSWTRAGGPLMRTTSADKFVEFVQNLDTVGGIHVNQAVMTIEPPTNVPTLQTCSRGGGTLSPSSKGVTLVVAEGDLLQAERLHNGIMFNVVKKEDLTIPSSSSNGSSVVHNNDSVADEECVQLDSLVKEMDAASSASSEEDDDGEQHSDTRIRGETDVSIQVSDE